MDHPDLEESIDRLYTVPPERFTQERDALARSLRGDKEAAGSVKGLRRPPATAWALNQLARNSPDKLAALFEADATLARAQREGAGREAVAEAGRARREIIGRLVSDAVSILTDAGHPGSQANRDRMAQTLTAVAVDEQGRDALARGRLTGDLTPESLWDSAAAAEPTEVDDVPDARAEHRRELRERAEELAAEARRLDVEASQLEEEAERAEAGARTARGGAIGARLKADEARRRSEDAARAAAE